MNARAPRRRISPRTIRRYRAIKNFLRRALGSTSQPDIKTNSSICVSVLDLREKIHGIEQQLNTVSKHCQDLVSLESKLKLKDDIDSEKDTYTRVNNIPDTKVLNKTSVHRCGNPVNSKSTPNVIISDDDRTNPTAQTKMLNEVHSYDFKENRKSKLHRRLDTIQESEQTLRSRKKCRASRTLPADLLKNRFQTIADPRSYNRHIKDCYSEVHRQRNQKKIEYLGIKDGFEKVNQTTEFRSGDYKNKNHRYKYLRPELDQDYITEIIKRQYRPVKLFGRRESDLSQISAPVCRDYEFPIRETVDDGSDLCSCCHEDHKHRYTRYMCNNDLSDVRSICDTRLYSSRKHKHHMNCKKRTDDYYNDSAMYDVVPVKEKCSPKSKRKFIEDNLFMQNKYREVPPSPRSQRPRLNLQAKYKGDDDNDDEIQIQKQSKQMKRLQRKSFVQNEGNISNMSSEVFIHNNNYKGFQNSQISTNQKPYTEGLIGTVSGLQYPNVTHDNIVINNDTTLNTHTTDVSADKTDKALSEIKDILQNFLQEIKKESPQSERLNTSVQANILQNETQNQSKTNSFNNNSIGHCGLSPFMQAFQNSCCYPIVPVCPMNCMHNGYVLPSPSFTCAACINNSKERTCVCHDDKNKTSSSGDASSETQKLIKEIHNLISQNPHSIKKNQFRNDNNKLGETKTCEETKILTSRSVGSKASKHDAKVGTSVMKSHSKSCEALGSREVTNTQYANVSYSDTILEKGSGEGMMSESVSDTVEYSSESTFIEKKKRSKFATILRSIGILKKNKTDISKDLSESNSSLEVKKPKQRTPFPQHIINYNMHGQECFNPHINPYNQLHQQQPQYPHSMHYNPSTCYSPVCMDNKINHSQRRHIEEHVMRQNSTSPHHIAVPPCSGYYDPHYVNVSPQPPVCFKEIEVKSIGTQSIKKLSLLEKLTNKMQAQQTKETPPKHSWTPVSSKEKNSNNLFDWKKIHEKAMQKTTDPLKFSYKTQKRLAEGDNTMRNVMLKKLFYKRNPFSPRNLLVRTLLGKDRSSFGEPPKMYKPKMFL